MNQTTRILAESVVLENFSNIRNSSICVKITKADFLALTPIALLEYSTYFHFQSPYE